MYPLTQEQACTCVIWSSSMLDSQDGRTASKTWRARSRVLRFPTRGTPGGRRQLKSLLHSAAVKWWCYQFIPEQHFCAAMLSSTSVHFGEAILDWMALEDTTLLRKTRKSPRCSSAVCCFRIRAEKHTTTQHTHTRAHTQSYRLHVIKTGGPYSRPTNSLLILFNLGFLEFQTYTL